MCFEQKHVFELLSDEQPCLEEPLRPRFEDLPVDFGSSKGLELRSRGGKYSPPSPEFRQASAFTLCLGLHSLLIGGQYVGTSADLVGSSLGRVFRFGGRVFLGSSSGTKVGLHGSLFRDKEV